MSNRASRRASKKLQHDPKIKKYVDRFAMDISKIFVDHFDKASKAMEEGKEVSFDIDQQMKDMMQQKGKELGNFVKDFMQEVDDDLNSKEIQKEHQKNQLKVILK